MSVVDDILCNNSHFMNSLDVLYNMFCHETSMPNTNDVLNECYDTCMAGLAESVMALCQPTSCRCSDSGQAPGRKHTRQKPRRRADWFDAELRAMRSKLRQLGRHRCGSRNEYKKFSNDYYHVCRQKRRLWTLDRMHVLERVCMSDRTLLWPQLDRIY